MTFVGPRRGAADVDGVGRRWLEGLKRHALA